VNSCYHLSCFALFPIACFVDFYRSSLPFRAWLLRRENNHALEFAASCVGRMPLASTAISSNLQWKTDRHPGWSSAGSSIFLRVGSRHPGGDGRQAAGGLDGRAVSSAALNRLPDVTGLWPTDRPDGRTDDSELRRRCIARRACSGAESPPTTTICWTIITTAIPAPSWARSSYRHYGRV